MKENRSVYIIITAGGVGQRMGANVPKQFLPLAGIPILCRTLMAFHRALNQAHLIVTLPKEHFGTWKELAEQHNMPEHQVCEGGNTRFYSIKNALALVPDKAIVLVHDGVRPLVSQNTILQAVEMTSDRGSAIPYLPISASLRRINGDGTSRVEDRKGMVQIQTPQGFDAQKLKLAYQLPFEDRFTDDATVFEAQGFPLFFFEDDQKNIKITTPNDLCWAEQLLKSE